MAFVFKLDRNSRLLGEGLECDPLLPSLNFGSYFGPCLKAKMLIGRGDILYVYVQCSL